MGMGTDPTSEIAEITGVFHVISVPSREPSQSVTYNFFSCEFTRLFWRRQLAPNDGLRATVVQGQRGRRLPMGGGQSLGRIEPHNNNRRSSKAAAGIDLCDGGRVCFAVVRERTLETKWASDKRMLSRCYGAPFLLRAARARGRNLRSPRITYST